jgi:hypothetical protein
MKRKGGGAQVSKSQLELPLGQQGAARNLGYYIGLCKVYAAYHKRWPTAAATREEFRAARIPDYDGQRIDRELRFPAPELEADPEYRALREHCLANDETGGVNLDALDPRHRAFLRDDAIAELFATIALPRHAEPGAVRYATGVLAHAHEELTLRLEEAVRTRALARAGLDPDNPQVLARGYSARVQATDELKSFIDRIGAPRLLAEERLADHLLLVASDQGRLYIQYQVLDKARYAGRFDVERLTEKLASVYAEEPDLARLRGAVAPVRPAAPALPAAPAPQSDAQLREQLGMLRPEGQSVKLPIQELSRFADIRRALEKAGGIYDPDKQQFDFEEGVEPALVVERLVKGAGS